MKTLVVDASVAAKWFFPEAGSDAATAILDGHHRLLAPELIWAELGSVVWKRRQRHLIDDAEAAGLLDECLRAPLDIHGSHALTHAAVRLAIQTSRSVYDCLYLALAIRERCTWITADLRMVHALEQSGWAAKITSLAHDAP